jgi:hypothetical protein
LIGDEIDDILSGDANLDLKNTVLTKKIIKKINESIDSNDFNSKYESFKLLFNRHKNKNYENIYNHIKNEEKIYVLPLFLNKYKILNSIQYFLLDLFEFKWLNCIENFNDECSNELFLFLHNNVLVLIILLSFSIFLSIFSFLVVFFYILFVVNK